VLLILAYIELLVATNDLQTDTEKQILIWAEAIATCSEVLLAADARS
jgi:hypothetical protein